MSHAQPLLAVEHLTYDAPGRGWFIRRAGARILDGVSLRLHAGEAMGIVGESGSGKTTLGRAILRLIEPTAGRVRFEGVELGALGRSELRRRRARMQMIFQDPGSSLNPRIRVADAVAEPILAHGLCVSRRQAGERACALLEACGIDKAMAQRFPHAFSGGQRQRIGIARALATGPALLVCDEPTSALDVSVQAQILNLLADLRAKMGLAMLFISHDMGVVQHVCDRVAVMHAGRIIEEGPCAQVLSQPTQEPTRKLVRAAAFWGDEAA